MKMKDRVLVAGMMVFFFVIGIIIFFYGVKNGPEFAVQVTRPAGATSWTTSEMQTKSVSYGICLFGGLWILLSHVLFVLFAARSLIFKTGRDA